jgi:hypothetical protein
VPHLQRIGELAGSAVEVDQPSLPLPQDQPKRLAARSDADIDRFGPLEFAGEVEPGTARPNAAVLVVFIADHGVAAGYRRDAADLKGMRCQDLAHSSGRDLARGLARALCHGALLLRRSDSLAIPARSRAGFSVA